MTPTPDQVRANAERLRALNSRIHETLVHRSRSAAARAEWQTACAEFHAAFDDLFFPGGMAGWSAFLAATPEGLELALIFLEAGRDTFRSGYHKEIVWRRLKRSLLTAAEQLRLEDVAVASLHKRVCREFWQMAAFVRLRGSASFWPRVEVLSQGAEPSAIKARWLLLARMNQPVRRWINSELWRSRHQPGDAPRLDFPLSKRGQALTG